MKKLFFSIPLLTFFVIAVVFAQSSDALFSIESDDGLILSIESTYTFESVNDLEPRNDIFLTLAGELINESTDEQCVRARQVRFVLDDTEYAPLSNVMSAIQDEYLDIDYIGAVRGLCVDAKDSISIFVSFDVPTNGDVVELLFVDERVTIDSDLAKLIENATEITQTLYTVRPGGAVNARECAMINSCAVLESLSPGTELIFIDTVEGDSFAGSTQWLLVELEGQELYVHSSLANLVPSPTPTSVGNSTIVKTYYVNSESSVNIRSCANTTCETITALNRGDELQVTDDTGDWYEIQLVDGRVGYIASFLTSATRPSTQPTAIPQQVVQPTTIPVQPTQVIQPTAVPVQPTQIPPPTMIPVQPTQVPVSTVPVQSEAPPQPAYTCGGNFYNCSDFTNRTDLMEYFNRCPGDPSDLDRDNDGFPCESLR